MSYETNAPTASRRPLRTIAIAVCVTALAALLALFLAPGGLEQRALGNRAALARAERAFEADRPAEAVAALQSAPETDHPSVEYMRAMLRYTAASGMVDAHFAVANGPSQRALSSSDLRQAMNFYARQDRPEMAVAMLNALASRDAATPSEMLQLARASAEAGQPRDAAAMARRIASRLRPGQDPPGGVFVIHTLAADGDMVGAQEFAARWLGAPVATDVVLSIAPAIVENNDPSIAVDVLRPRRRQSKDAEAAFAFAIRRASASDQRLRAELTQDLLAAVSSQSNEANDVRIHDLFAFGDFAVVQDALSRDGSWRNEPLRAAFIAAMKAHGRTTQMRDLLVAEASRASPEDQRRAARQLAELGFAPSACAVLTALAAREGPQGSAMRDLQYVWRAHQITPDMAWLTARAAAADEGQAVAWVEQIALAGSARDALASLAHLESAARADARPALLVLRARYLAWSNDSPELRRVLTRAAEQPLTVVQAREALDIACAIGDGESVRRLSLTQEPADTPAIRACRSAAALDTAHAAQRRGDTQMTIAAFSEAARLDLLGSQDLFDFAQALERAGAPAEARYQAALAALPAPQRGSLQNEMLRVAILMRLGQRREAQGTLERLLERDPANRDVRIRLADLYVDGGAYRSALALTSGQGATATTLPAASSP